MEDEFISQEEVVVTPRRNREYNKDLLTMMKKVNQKKGLRLGSTYGKVPQEDQAHIRYEIRKHWDQVRDEKPSIKFTPDGIPQVVIDLREKGKV